MIDLGIRYVEDELMPAILQLDGCVGLSMMVDRATGRCITTSAWETEDAMRTSAPQVQPLRDQYVATLGADAPLVDEWEVDLMHRDHPSIAGAWARTSWLQCDPNALPAATDGFRAVLPTLEDLPGFGSASLLINRDTGLAASTVTFDSADSLIETRAIANTLRTRVAQGSGPKSSRSPSSNSPWRTCGYPSWFDSSARGTVATRAAAATATAGDQPQLVAERSSQVGPEARTGADADRDAQGE